jgi:dynein heavy chain
MFPPDERERIVADVREWAAKQPGAPSGKEAVWAAFINRVRDNLHVVLALSPVGEAFRARWGSRRLAGRAAPR